MRLFAKYLAGSPVAVRILPFLLFFLVTLMQGHFFAGSAYWCYLAKTLLGVWMIYEIHPVVSEMRWAFSWEAVVVGIGIFVLWIGISGEWTTQNSLWVKLGVAHAPQTPSPVWNPNETFGNGSPMAWLFILVHILGSTLVVPPIEEIFYRSFLYRYIARPDFSSVALNQFLLIPFVATGAVFGLSHNEWLAGILCGLAYQWLVLRKNRLGDAMTAHAVTNFLLGLWVVWRGAWHFW